MTEMCDQSACLMPHSPFFGHLLTVETIPELNDSSTPLSQDARIFHVVPHQLGCAAMDLKWYKIPWVTHGTDLSHPSHGCLMGLI